MTAYNVTAQKGVISSVGYEFDPTPWRRFLTAERGVFTVTGQNSYPVAPGERQQFGIVT